MSGIPKALVIDRDPFMVYRSAKVVSFFRYPKQTRIWPVLNVRSVTKKPQNQLYRETDCKAPCRSAPEPSFLFGTARAERLELT